MSKKEQIKHSPECGWILQVMDTLKKLFKNTKKVLRYVIILKKMPIFAGNKIFAIIKITIFSNAHCAVYMELLINVTGKRKRDEKVF
jgi:hypothetical protein